ncbi:MAG: hypothetical protein AAGD32_03975 [Planctomycetota bacterium]
MSPPFWIPALLVFAGLLVALVLRSVAKVPAIGLSVAAVGLLWFGVDLVTETNREEALRRTSTIINAAADRDWEAFGDAMDGNTRLPGRYANRDQFLAGAEATIETIDLKSVFIRSRQVGELDGVIDVDTVVLSVQAATHDRPEKTTWRFRYVETDDGLVLDLIQPLEVRGQDVSIVMDAISRFTGNN